MMKLNTSGIGQPTTPKWRNTSRALRFLFNGLITILSGTNAFPDSILVKIVFWCGVGGLLIQTMDIFKGVPPEEQ